MKWLKRLQHQFVKSRFLKVLLCLLHLHLKLHQKLSKQRLRLKSQKVDYLLQLVSSSSRYSAMPKKKLKKSKKRKKQHKDVAIIVATTTTVVVATTNAVATLVINALTMHKLKKKTQILQISLSKKKVTRIATNVVVILTTENVMKNVMMM